MQNMAQDSTTTCVPNSATTSTVAQPPKQGISSKPRMLTPSEIESLRQDKHQTHLELDQLIAADKAKNSA